ncbi:hypothetical protein B0I33_1137 [Prauserella shujinwangii]|uniref:Uncharacterized protein n=1 Tax=Prauserella shujinwangii TaxID=1453103 RepID=A0A2T0LLD1_9PSEU|nr:hypothetical protein [Prauserella shujinwangii]PRX43844.1 hypothetical protein B0I33_1137 [Prauserella shujinwangii]
MVSPEDARPWWQYEPASTCGICGSDEHTDPWHDEYWDGGAVTCTRKDRAADPAFAYRYLSSAVRAYLDGECSAEYVRLVLDKLDTAVYAPGTNGGEGR